MAKSARKHLTRDIIVVGASAGGVQVLQELVRGLPPDFPGSVFVVVHVSPTSPGILPSILDRAGPLVAKQARDGERIRPRHIYVAPPDHHLILKRDRLCVTRGGPKENGFRPAVDPLFRTAARSYGSRVVGVILTGGLDDGTIGMAHVKEHGGVAIAQDPAEAVFPSMPQSVIRNVEVDHVLSVGEIPELLMRLATEPMSEGALAMANPNDELPDVAETGKAMLASGTPPVPPTDIICPQCGGSLWELEDRKITRYECHVGHSYTAETLLEDKNGELEGALWGALRALEEGAELRRRMADRLQNAPSALGDVRERYQREADESEARAAVLRQLLGNGNTAMRLARQTSAEGKAKSVRNQSIGKKGRGEQPGNGRSKSNGRTSQARNPRRAGKGSDGVA
jgi:two-component system, chemotaxis family, protein-glutamate methylesterase/glutaminase